MRGRLVPLAGRHRDRRHPAPVGELRLGGEAGRATDLDEQPRRADRGDPILGQRAAEPAQQGRDLLDEFADPRVQAGDVAGCLDQPREVDPVGGRDLDRAGRSPPRSSA
jgi:hypothetical protein